MEPEVEAVKEEVDTNEKKPTYINKEELKEDLKFLNGDMKVTDKDTTHYDKMKGIMNYKK